MTTEWEEKMSKKMLPRESEALVREWPRSAPPPPKKRWGATRGGRRAAGDRQERLRQGWRGAGDASRFDSRPAPGRGEGREG